ncbi:hypothetical protein E2P81_ATG07026 [Venturia nashicola]|uniref:THUMP domain-containing protein n=1 Tax=Venturia nashicola TaxID=86259 RepID=A0A4Z1NF44_9PEZI|nr:hypothetical protein E6O75_ATG07191 [Venturia nashicola]TLD19409.1 hypothetical protein E2P81_ATG07026 [Venturia nashicola]
MMPQEKRKATDHVSQSSSEKKVKKQWTTPKQGYKGGGKSAYSRDIEPGDVGIWASCNKGKEGKCVAELKDLFQEYADRMYVSENGMSDAAKDASEDDVGAEIEKELQGLKKPQTEAPFSSIKLDTPCPVVFFKVRAPIEPVAFVHTICKDAAASAHRKQSRSVKRLTPITLVGKATESGIEEVARSVLRPHFHDGVRGKKVNALRLVITVVETDTDAKFAIRSNIRNHSTLKRDVVIKQVAGIVGADHHVDLKAYDFLILVEIYKNICGISVVGSDFEELKRYNLSEMFDPTPATSVAATK